MPSGKKPSKINPTKKIGINTHSILQQLASLKQISPQRLAQLVHDQYNLLLKYRKIKLELRRVSSQSIIKYCQEQLQNCFKVLDYVYELMEPFGSEQALDSPFNNYLTLSKNNLTDANQHLFQLEKAATECSYDLLKQDKNLSNNLNNLFNYLDNDMTQLIHNHDYLNDLINRSPFSNLKPFVAEYLISVKGLVRESEYQLFLNAKENIPINAIPSKFILEEIQKDNNANNSDVTN